MTSVDISVRAAQFARERHQGQARKYTGEPYYEHCRRVAIDHLALFHYPEEVIAAGFLHDTLEDTDTTREELECEFGLLVSRLVWEVTDQSRPEDGNRAARKAVDRQHLGRASRFGHAIKLADVIDNTTDIATHDPKFAEVYLPEIRDLLDAICLGHNELLEHKARRIYSAAVRACFPTSAMAR